MELYLLIFVTIIFTMTGITAAILIVKYLKSRNISANILLWGLLFVKYLRLYKQIGISEKGTVGFLFYLYIVSLNIALLTFVLILLLNFR